jgi:hypothetical protein
MKIVWYLVLVGSFAVSASPVIGKDKELQEVRPAIFEELVACRSIVDAGERLACYDSRVAAMDEAEKKDELVLADSNSMKEAKRGLFGFSIPKLKIFGNDSVEEEKFVLVAKIDSAFQTGNGQWTIILDDGARWVQVDTQTFVRNPAKDMEIKIREAAMGSYFANIAGQRAIRMRRVN